MTQLTILHRGVPIGFAGTAARSDAEPGDAFAFSFLDFQPLAAYEAVRPVVRRAADAFFGWCLHPAVDPTAHAAAQTLWDTLELADASGRPVAGRVVWFLESLGGGQPSYWLDVELDDAGATVAAPVRVPPWRALDYRSPGA